MPLKKVYFFGFISYPLTITIISLVCGTQIRSPSSVRLLGNFLYFLFSFIHIINVDEVPPKLFTIKKQWKLVFCSLLIWEFKYVLGCSLVLHRTIEYTGTESNSWSIWFTRKNVCYDWVHKARRTLQFIAHNIGSWFFQIKIKNYVENCVMHLRQNL